MTAAAAWVLTIVLAAAPAEAISRLHFQRAQKHFAAHEYRRALEQFTLANENAPAEVPELYFDIAQCHRNLGHARLAVLAFQHYLMLRPDAPDRAQVRSLIVQLGGKPPADDSPGETSSTAPAALPPSSSATSAPRSFDVPGPPEEPKLTALPAPAPAVEAAPALVATTVESAPAPRKHRRWPIWVGVAGGVALTALTVGLAAGLSSPSSSPSHQVQVTTPPSSPMLGSAGTFDTRSH